MNVWVVCFLFTNFVAFVLCKKGMGMLLSVTFTSAYKL
jgi:hypothetical protein